MELTIEKINSDIETLIDVKVKEFLEGDKDVKIPRYALDKIITILKKNKFKDLKDYDSNGYQVDFWYTVQHPKKGKCVLSGDLYYNNSFTLGTADSQSDIDDDGC
jgi:hypothetical protein